MQRTSNKLMQRAFPKAKSQAAYSILRHDSNRNKPPAITNSYRVAFGLVFFSRWLRKGTLFTMLLEGCSFHYVFGRVLFSRRFRKGVLFALLLEGCSHGSGTVRTFFATGDVVVVVFVRFRCVCRLSCISMFRACLVSFVNNCMVF